MRKWTMHFRGTGEGGSTIQFLEPRRLLAGVAVTATDDLPDGDISSIANLLANPGPTGINIREAITAANNTPGADVIAFNIAGAGPHTLQLNSALPNITDTLNINGYTQPGAAANTLALGINAVIKIQLSGVGGIGVGLNVLAPDCVIQGLSMTAFNQPAVAGSGAILLQAPGAVIEGNWLGIGADGTVSGNRRGIGGTIEAVNVRIGGTTPAARNVISGNITFGIGQAGGNAVIQGNYIGTNATGTASVPNGVGVGIGGSDSTLGGPGIGARNVISGNSGNGVEARGEGHSLEGNFIGPGANGEPIGNGGDGIRIVSPIVSDGISHIGADEDTFNAPVVAYNGGHGVNIVQGNAVVGQVAIHNNGGTGINLNQSGPAITLSSAVSTTTATTVNGLITGLTPGRAYIIRFYGNTDGGEYEAFVDSFGIEANASGQVPLIDLPLRATGLSNVSAILTELGEAGESDFTVARADAIANSTPPVILITTTAGSGVGSMSAAFTAANATPGPEVILFNIPGSGFVDIAPATSITPFLGRISNVLFEGRGQGFGSALPRTYVNVNNGLGTFNGGANNTVAGVGFFNVSGRAFDAELSNNTLIHSTVGIGAAEQPLGVSSIVFSDVVRIIGGNNNQIVQNVIHAGRGNACVSVYAGTNHLIQDNRIGITQTGVVLGGTATTNNRVGVVINDGTGTDVIENIIAGMVQDAIKSGEFGTPGGTGHRFTGNSMFQNQQSGIDLGDNGVTPNDGPGDADTGPNNLQNYPVLTSAEQVPGGVRAIGTFTSGFNQDYTIEAWASSNVPIANIDEGGRSLGTFPLSTDADGTVPFDVIIPGGAVFGEVILVTATDAQGNTSEFAISVPLVDTLAPTVSNGAFEFDVTQAVTWQTSEGAIAGVSNDDVVVQTLPSGGALQGVAAFFLEDENTVTYVFAGVGGGTIADGNYRATFQPDSIQDAAGNPGPPPGFTEGGNPRVVDFFVFAGDANRDRVIDIGDFAILAGRFNLPGTFSQGDFNYDGLVDIGDFSILASKFNTALPAFRAVDRFVRAESPSGRAGGRLLSPSLRYAPPIWSDRPAIDQVEDPGAFAGID